MTVSKISKDRVQKAVSFLESCTLCPRHCAVNRLEDEKGFCGTGRLAVVSSVVSHHGEEPPISGRRGSGTIFFTNCNLSCKFCQNSDISQEGHGEEMCADDLADAMLDLQERGCHNINLVTPSHVGPQILEALLIALEKGFDLPIVWNSGGYDGIKTLKLFCGIVDVYMPDFKYGRNKEAALLSRASDYNDRSKEAIREMYNQVGGLVIDEDGVAVRGLLVRHLVLPGNLSHTIECLDFLSEKISRDIGLSLMSQYRPAFKAIGDPVLGRTLKPDEYAEAVKHAEEIDFRYTWIQGLESAEQWVPDFNKSDPFKKWRKG